jgi:SPP1 family predicted phage head-tail adaptor
MLRHRITILQNQGTASLGNGNVTPDWNEMATVWAKVDSLGGTEQFFAAQMVGEETLKFTIRYPSFAVSAGMRVSYGGKLYEIKSVSNLDEGHWLEIMGTYSPILG